MMKISLVVALAVSVMPLVAHHSVAAEFDMSKTVAIKGAVAKVEFMNPHVLLWVDVKNADGTVSNWELELPPPNYLRRTLGADTGKDLLKPGDQISATLWRAKDGALVGCVLSMTFPDGRAMNLPTGWL